MTEQFPTPKNEAFNEKRDEYIRIAANKVAEENEESVSVKDVQVQLYKDHGYDFVDLFNKATLKNDAEAAAIIEKMDKEYPQEEIDRVLGEVSEL